MAEERKLFKTRRFYGPVINNRGLTHLCTHGGNERRRGKIVEEIELSE
jgi:hypothetical protein